MATDVAAALACDPSEVLVASTGVIGVNLRMDRVSSGIAGAVTALARGKGSETARAIMTTDPFPKEYAVTVQTGRGSFRVGGTAKGSGMIEPNMATMLGFLTTDASVSPALLDRAWFFLAKICQQRGYLAESEAALGRIGSVLPEDLEPQRQML